MTDKEFRVFLASRNETLGRMVRENVEAQGLSMPDDPETVEEAFERGGKLAHEILRFAAEAYVLKGEPLAAMMMNVAFMISNSTPEEATDAFVALYKQTSEICDAINEIRPRDGARVTIPEEPPRAFDYGREPTRGPATPSAEVVRQRQREEARFVQGGELPEHMREAERRFNDRKKPS